MFRSARSEDIDILHQLLLAEAAEGRIDPRLADEPYRSALRGNLNNIRKKGRRLDEDLAAQLLAWEKDGKVAGCLINSAIMPDTGNEIWLIAVLPECRGQGEGRRALHELLAHLHPRVDVFARCAPAAGIALQMFLKRGFLPLDRTAQGVHILKLPKMGASMAGQRQSAQALEAFVPVQV